jgi:hypothetical protein
MDTVLLDSAYGSLGLLLGQLSEMPEITSSSEAIHKLQNAMLFYKEIGLQYQRVLNELDKSMSSGEYLDNNNDHSCIDLLTTPTKKYVDMRLAGANAQKVCSEAKTDGLNTIQRIKLLRSVFGLSLEESHRIESSTD